MTRVPLYQMNFAVRREACRQTLVYQALLLLSGLALAIGFVVAAGQHFAAVRYGYMSEELRRERAALIEEERRLLLSLEEAASPARLERAAKELGLHSRKIATITYRASELERARRDASPEPGVVLEAPPTQQAARQIEVARATLPRTTNRVAALVSAPVTALQR